MPHMKRRARSVDKELIEVADRFASVPSVTAAGTITLPEDDDLVQVTGSTSVTSITAPRDIRHVTLRVAAGEAVDIALASSSIQQFLTAIGMDKDSFLHLFHDGTVWHETGRHYGDLWHEVDGSGEPAFVTGWGNVGGANETAGFVKTEENTVLLKGYVTRSSGVASIIFTLPVGYRPSLRVRFIVPANNAFAEIRVNTAGRVNLNTGSATNVGIDGIEVELDT